MIDEKSRIKGYFELGVDGVVIAFLCGDAGLGHAQVEREVGVVLIGGCWVGPVVHLPELGLLSLDLHDLGHDHFSTWHFSSPLCGN